MANNALRTILPVVGWPEARAGEVEITGQSDPILPTPFRLGETSTATLAAVGLAVSDLWKLRTGRGQEVAVDTRRATASLRSGRYLKIDGESVSTAFDPIMGNYPAKNGRWSYLHCNFPNHRAAALKVLGVPEDYAAVRMAVAQWDAFELEEAIIAAKGAGGMVRTMEEWARHPQAAAVASLPLMEIMKIGASPPEALPRGNRPLSGIRVLDLTRVIAGPTCARTLAEHGADVLHIASLNLPTFEGFEMDTGHGKRQAYIDLNEPEQAETLRELIRGADVFSQGFQHRTLERRGFGVEQVARLRPGIIYVSENAFGHDGPWQERPGWEQLAQATTGVTVVQGGEGPPVLAPAAMNDYTTGYFAALGTMMALRRRSMEGGSWRVTVSLSQTSMWYYRLGADLDRSAASGLGETGPFLEERDTGYGRMTHLGPALRMSDTQPHWELATSPLGTSEARWSQVVRYSQ